jgi:hypothetical protein
LRRGVPPSNISFAARTGGGDDDADEDEDDADDDERLPSLNEPSRGSSGRLWGSACGAWVS